MTRAEKLAKLVDAAGDRCPKALDAELIERITWVAAYRVIRYPGRFRAILWFGMFLSMGTFGFLLAIGVTQRWYASSNWLLYYGPTIGFATIVAIQLIPVAIIMDWMYARRLMYVKLGGREDLSELRFPGLRRRGYSSGVVKRLIRQVFGDETPSAEALNPGNLLAIRGAMREWEASPMPWRRPR